MYQDHVMWADFLSHFAEQAQLDYERAEKGLPEKQDQAEEEFKMSDLYGDMNGSRYGKRHSEENVGYGIVEEEEEDNILSYK